MASRVAKLLVSLVLSTHTADEYLGQVITEGCLFDHKGAATMLYNNTIRNRYASTTHHYLLKTEHKS